MFTRSTPGNGYGWLHGTWSPLKRDKNWGNILHFQSRHPAKCIITLVAANVRVAPPAGEVRSYHLNG